MFKNLASALILLVLLMACQQKKNNAQMSISDGENAASSTTETVTTPNKGEVFNLKSVEELQNKAEKLINKKVSVSGIVTHVCKHSGKRCFISTIDEKFKIRVEANDQINSFNQDLIGNEITVKGIVREKRVEKTPEGVVHNHNKSLSHEGEQACESEKEEAKQMAENSQDKDYIAVYYLDGISFQMTK